MCTTTQPNRQTNTLTAPMAATLRAAGFAIGWGQTGWHANHATGAAVYPAYTGHGFVAAPTGICRGVRRATLARAIATALGTT